VCDSEVVGDGPVRGWVDRLAGVQAGAASSGAEKRLGGRSGWEADQAARPFRARGYAGSRRAGASGVRRHGRAPTVGVEGPGTPDAGSRWFRRGGDRRHPLSPVATRPHPSSV